MKRIALMLVMAALAASSQAAIVSYNFDCYGTVGNPDGSYNGDMVAGVVPAVGWHNTWWTDPKTDLTDNTGAATTIDISWSSFNMYGIQPSTHPGQDADGTYNKELLNGYLNAGAQNWANIAQSSVTLSEIGYSSYDIIVYFSSDVAGRTGTVADGTTTYYFNTVGAASIASGNALFMQAIDSTVNGYNTAANYAVFSGLSGASQTLTVDIPNYGGIAGVQIVSVPEPATLVLLGLGGLVLRKRS